MRRAAVVLLLACGCGSSSPAPQPPVLALRPAPPTSASPEPPEPAEPPAVLELSGTARDARLTCREPDGKTRYEVQLGEVQAVLGAPDGGAYVILLEPRQHLPGVVKRIDWRGRELWKHARLLRSTSWQLTLAGDRLVVLDVRGENVSVLEAGSGERIDAFALPKKLSDVAASGGVVVVADERGVSRLGLDGATAWSVPVRLFPSLEPRPEREAQRRVAVGTDGTVLTGASDGSLVAFDLAGKPLYQLGVRGAVASIEAGPGGGFLVHSDTGQITVVGRGGVVGAEPAVDAGPVPPEPAPVVDKRERPVKTEPAACPATAAYQAVRARSDGKPLLGVGSVVELGPDDVWALVRGRPGPGGGDESYHAYHFDGRVWVDLGVPEVAFRTEVFAAGQPPARGTFTPAGLARSPRGSLLVFGTRSAGAPRMCMLERVGQAWRERREIFETVAKLPPAYYSLEDLTHASSPGGREVLCHCGTSFDNSGETIVTCVELGPGGPPRVLPDEAGTKMPDGWEMVASRGHLLGPVLYAGETLWRANGWAAGPDDVFGLSGATLSHWNGSSFVDRRGPFERSRAVWGRTPTDLWLTGDDGVAHFDGERFRCVPGIDGAPPSEGLSDRHPEHQVTGSGADGVWVFGPAGLWHVAPTGRVEPEREPAASPPVMPSAPSVALAVGPVDHAYRLERVVLDVDGAEPLRAAISVAAAPGGLLWFFDGVRLVEHDGVRSRQLYHERAPEPFVCWSTPEPDCEFCATCTERQPRELGCQRCVAPTAAGQGALVSQQGLLPFDQGGVTGAPHELFALNAVVASPAGSVWAVSARAGDRQPHAVILDRTGLRLASGLPPMAYADVAVRADDDVWLAGGASSGQVDYRAWPEGEGALVHFDGNGFRHHRAPLGALLAVAAVGPAQAWAAGLAGGLLHAEGGKVQAFHLEQDGARLPVLLRAVAATGPDDLWIAGDGATLLHWDGKTLCRVDTGAAGPRAPLTAIVAPAALPGWVVGPSGIWRLVAASTRAGSGSRSAP